MCLMALLLFATAFQGTVAPLAACCTAQSQCPEGSHDDNSAVNCPLPTGYMCCVSDVAPPDSCISSPCLNGGSCINTQPFQAGYFCKCLPGFTDANCAFNINECASSPCRNGATCVDKAGGFECQCSRGYDGPTCLDDINDCLSSPCVNGGTCVDEVNGVTCFCSLGSSGARCEVVETLGACASQPCRNNGLCHAYGQTVYSCLCVAGYTGLTCNLAPKPSTTAGPITTATRTLTKLPKTLTSTRRAPTFGPTANASALSSHITRSNVAVVGGAVGGALALVGLVVLLLVLLPRRSSTKVTVLPLKEATLNASTVNTAKSRMHDQPTPIRAACADAYNVAAPVSHENYDVPTAASGGFYNLVDCGVPAPAARPGVPHNPCLAGGTPRRAIPTSQPHYETPDYAMQSTSASSKLVHKTAPLASAVPANNYDVVTDVVFSTHQPRVTRGRGSGSQLQHLSLTGGDATGLFHNPLFHGRAATPVLNNRPLEDVDA